MKKTVFLLLAIAFFSVTAQPSHNMQADEGGKISGRIVDSVSAEPVEFATISLVTQDGDKVINGTLANEKGEFALSNVNAGVYKIMIAFIGYETKKKSNITIDKSNSTITLGDIPLKSNQKILKEIEITSEKSLIENKIDKLVYNVDKDIGSQTGVAADVLKKVPQVTVDVDGNVELLGNASILFLINGKPSAVYGNNITDVLQSIPASQIQSIEVITSPGVKYDAQGTGGIINIILKKSTAEGVNANISLSAGTRLENGSFNISAHHKHLSVNAFLSGNEYLSSTTITDQTRTSPSNTLIQNGTSVFSRKGYQAGAGFDWELTPKDNISGSLGYNYFGNNNSGTTDRSTLIDSSGNTSNDRLNTSGNAHSEAWLWQLDYKRKFEKKDQELDISYLSSIANNYNYYQQTQENIVPEGVYAGSYASNPGTDKETIIAIDYTQPFEKDVMLETGAKLSISQINSVSDMYLLDIPTDAYSYSNTQSSSLNYTSDVYAAYISAQFRLFNYLDAKAGFRYEYTDLNAHFSNAGNVYLNPYGTYVPSAVISHTFKNHQTLKLAYTHRIERPQYRDLNPFVNASDPKNLTAGNTTLVPEIGDKIELGFNQTFEKGTNINVTLFYRGQSDDIQPFTRYYPAYKVGDSTYNNVTVTTRENIGRENNFGISIFSSIPATAKISFRTNISGFQRYIFNGAAGGNTQGFNYRINATASYTVSDNLIVEFFGNFNSPRVNAQGTLPSFTTYNVALRKQFFNKKASVALTATNFFNEYVNQKTQLTGTDFTLYNLRELPFQSFGINVTYKFGKLQFKKEKREEDPNLDNPPTEN